MDLNPTEALKQIHDAEIRAEEIVKAAQSEGNAILEKARAKAREIIEAPREEWAREHQKKIQEKLAPLEADIQARYENAREKIRETGLKNKAGVDRMVEKLIRIILP